MSKHTPGPWKFRINHNGTFTLFGDDGGRVLMCDAGLINRDANAPLISAAPELLEALIEVAASLAWNAHGESRAVHEGPIMSSAMAIETASAAIAKARGN